MAKEKKIEKVMIGKEISWPGNEKRVMLNANDLLVFLLCDTKDENEAVTNYRLFLAEGIAKLINDPIVPIKKERT